MVAHFTAAGQRLEYEILGEGVPLLILTNIGVPASSMRGFAPMLNSAGFQVVLLDHLGPAEASIEEIASHVGSLIAALDLDPWVWGYSQGAFIAQEVALLCQDRVRGVVLVATRARRSRFFDLFLAASQEIDCASGVPDRVAAVFSLLATTPPDLLDDDDHVDFALRRSVAARSTHDAERTRRSLRASAAYGDRLQALREMSVPCLVIAFERDLVCPPRLGRELADAVPAGEYLEIAGGAHGGLLTHAPEVMAATTDFLTRALERTPHP